MRMDCRWRLLFVVAGALAGAGCGGKAYLTGRGLMVRATLAPTADIGCNALLLKRM